MTDNPIAFAIGYLKLKIPYSIIIKSRLRDCAGLYNSVYHGDTLVNHRISISLYHTGKYFVRDLNTVIVHELIHAWQEENGIIETHGIEFQQMAVKLGGILNMPNIYLKDYDV